MLRIIINPTWRCQLACAYCWVRALGWHTRTREIPAIRWLWWVRQLEPGSVIDFSGGEPLLYDGIMLLLNGLSEAHVRWAMTTNLVRETVLRRLLDEHPAGCIQINTSWHTQSPMDFWERVAELARYYRVSVNVVDHPSAPAVPAGLPGAITVNCIPYQPFLEGQGIDGLTRICNAGMYHLTCDPEGNVYRCLVAMQKGEAPLGMVSESPDTLRLLDARLCEGGCTTCYTDNPAAWMVTMEGASA